jgi:hypothetical protein
MTAATTADGYDVVNLQRPALAPGWKSGTSTADEKITVDLGSAQSISAFALINHDLTTETLELEYATDSGFTTGTGTVTLSLTSDNWYQFFGAVTRRYWRLKITKALATDTVSAGRMVLGQQFTPTYAFRPQYASGNASDTSQGVRTRGGQYYSTDGVRLRTLRGVMPGLSDTDYDEIELLKRTYGTSTPFILALNWETDPTRLTLYGHLTGLAAMQNVAVDKWEWNVSMREQR